MELQKRCFKIDKTNAEAMIGGYIKNGKRVHQSIWCAVTTGAFPALVTLNRTKTKFPMSDIGASLRPESYLIRFKYIAKLDSQYFLRNDIRLWERMCANGLFDVWDPIAPKMRFDHSKSDPSNFRIQLIRLYESHETFPEHCIDHVSDRIDHLIAANRNVTIKSPIISDEVFSNIKNLLQNSVADFRTPEPHSRKRRHPY